MAPPPVFAGARGGWPPGGSGRCAARYPLPRRRRRPPRPRSLVRDRAVRPRRGPHAAVGEGRGTPTSTTRAGPAGRRGVGGGVVVGGMGRSDEARTQRGARGGSGKGGTRPRSGPHGGVGRSGLTCPARPTARDQGGRRDRCVDVLPRNHRGAVPIDSGGKPPIGPWTSLTPDRDPKNEPPKGWEGGGRSARAETVAAAARSSNQSSFCSPAPSGGGFVAVSSAAVSVQQASRPRCVIVSAQRGERASRGLRSNGKVGDRASTFGAQVGLGVQKGWSTWP